MLEMSIKDEEIQTLKKNQFEKDIDISSKKVTSQKDILIKEAQDAKKQLNDKWFKANTKFIGKVPLFKARCIIWDHISLEVTKFREYLNLVDEEHHYGIDE